MAYLSDEQIKQVKNICSTVIRNELEPRRKSILDIDANNLLERSTGLFERRNASVFERNRSFEKSGSLFDKNSSFERRGSLFDRTSHFFERNGSLLADENDVMVSLTRHTRDDKINMDVSNVYGNKDSFDSSEQHGKDFVKQISKIRRRYQDGFTMHALNHVIHGTWIERIFWCLKLCLAITVAVNLSWHLLQNYRHHHVDSKVSIETRTTLQLPMLFICGTHAKYYLATYTDCFSDESKSYDEEICKEVKSKCPHFCWNKNDSHLIEDGNVLCAEGLLGQCITINANGKLFQTATRPAGVYSKKVTADHLPLWIYVKTPGSAELIPRSWFQFSRINIHGDYHVILEKTSIKRLPYPYSNPSCIVQESEEALSRNIFIGNYTLDKCLTTCYTLSQLKTCGTTHTTYRAQLRNPDSFKHLFEDKNVSEINHCMNDRFNDTTNVYEECRVKCTIPCVENSYRVSLRYEPPSNATSSRINIYFYYQEMKETVVEQRPSLSISTLVANFGGQLGLMAGVSAISIVELMIWFVLFGIECMHWFFQS